MTWSSSLQEYTERFWRRRQEELQDAGKRFEQALSRCGEEERLLLRYVLSTLPLSDLGEYPPELFLGFVREARKAREDFSWCAALPEHLFLREVLSPRINTEQLEDCRGLFRKALEDRVRDLPLAEAILEVNRWCAGEVTYRSTDDRTASPLAVYRCGLGRCGEESTFAVTALRSVGISARQVYAPRWSHCDDNHAWVEAFDGERWRFLGACEPEPELDRGWFPGAASRAMLIHARSFVQGDREDVKFLFPEADPLTLDLRQGVADESVTARYGRTRPVTVTVTEEKTTLPLTGVRVDFSVLNMGEFFPIASRKTDTSGKASLELGLGSVWVSARAEGSGSPSSERLLDVSKTGQAALSLPDSERKSKGEWEDLDFLAPAAPAKDFPPLTAAQKAERRVCLNHAAVLRAEKAARREREKRSFSWEAERILDTLTEKDRSGGVEEAVFQDSREAFAWEQRYPQTVFETALLCPRIGLEPLLPWRRLLAESFPKSEKQAFREAPQQIWTWVERNIREREGYPELPAGPGGMFRLKAASRQGKQVLFCALCRAFGIPARLSPMDGTPEYYENGGFRPVMGGRPMGRVELHAPAEQAALFRWNYTLAQRNVRGWKTLQTADIPAGGTLSLSLPAGEYRLVTVSRMPNGNQLARLLDFALKEREGKSLLLSFRRGAPKDMLEHLPLPSFSLEDREGKAQNGIELLRTSPLSLLCWLEAGREPTEHILNEMREVAEAFRNLGRKLSVLFLLEKPEDENDPALQKALAALPEAKLRRGDFQDTLSLLARRMYVDPDRLPLILLADREGNGLYACSGYNVGTAELVLRLSEEALTNKNSVCR